MNNRSWQRTVGSVTLSDRQWADLPVQDIFGRIHSGECACKCTLSPFVKEFHRKSTWKSEFEVTKICFLAAASVSRPVLPPGPCGRGMESPEVEAGRGGGAHVVNWNFRPRHFTPAPLIFQWCASHPSSSLIFTQNLKLKLKLRWPIVRGCFCRSPLNTDSHQPAQKSAHVTAI